MSRKKQLQRLKPVEDERKLQMKLFVKLCVEAKSQNHHLMIVEIKKRVVSTEKSGLFFVIEPKIISIRFYKRL